MSIHKSLKPKDKLKRERNVLTRRERVKKLMEHDQFDEEEDSVFGLPKLNKSRQSPAAALGETDETEASSGDEEGEPDGEPTASDDGANE